MLIWGSRTVSNDLGQEEVKACPTCEKERPFHLYAQYRLHHIWYLFKWVTQRQYLRLCEICHRGTEVAAETLAPDVARAGVPLFHRFSWTILPALLAVGIAFGILDDQRRDRRNAELIAAPKVGDYYAADIARLGRSGGDDKYRYGVMKVRSVSADNVEFVLPRVGYSKISGALKELTSPDADKADNYGTSAVQVPKADLKALLDSGVMHSIKRLEAARQ